MLKTYEQGSKKQGVSEILLDTVGKEASLVIRAYCMPQGKMGVQNTVL